MIFCGTDAERDKKYNITKEKRQALVKQRKGKMPKPSPNFLYIDKDMGFESIPKNYISYRDQVLNYCHSLMHNFPNKEAKKAKKFMQNYMLGSYINNVNNPIIKLITDPKILSPVSNYIGHLPIITAAFVSISKPTGDKLRSSQLFHCDWDYNSMKLMILLSDVDMENGPLHIFDATTSKYIRDNIGYTYGPGESKYRIFDNTIYKYANQNDLISFTGKQGDMFFVSTSSCFHYGSRLEDGAKERAVLVIKFSSIADFNIDAVAGGQRPFKHLNPQELLFSDVS